MLRAPENSHGAPKRTRLKLAETRYVSQGKGKPPIPWEIYSPVPFEEPRFQVGRIEYVIEEGGLYRITEGRAKIHTFADGEEERFFSDSMSAYRAP